jgi:hypothetical protein
MMRRFNGFTGNLRLEEVIPALQELALPLKMPALHKLLLLSDMAQATYSAASWPEVDREDQVLRLPHHNQINMAHHSIKCPNLRLVLVAHLHLNLLSRVVATNKDPVVHPMDIIHSLPNPHRLLALVRVPA